MLIPYYDLQPINSIVRHSGALYFEINNGGQCMRTAVSLTGWMTTEMFSAAFSLHFLMLSVLSNGRVIELYRHQLLRTGESIHPD